jgi:L-ascorbate metabolism protein UlaG (beta-lactamase superfamily)
VTFDEVCELQVGKWAQQPIEHPQKEDMVNIQLIRNATMKITYAGRTILTDPMLSPKGAIRSFANIAPNPTTDLPFPAAEVVQGINSVLVTHTHPDHFDSVAGELLPKEIPVFCQPGDEGRFTGDGFQNVIPIETSHTWEDITITRTGGRHGSGPILERMGKVSGFVLQADGEPTVYWVGDSIWCEEVEQAIRAFHPDIIITHSGGATIPGFDPILMGEEDTLKAVNTTPNATIVAIHTESLDHCPVTRGNLQKMADEAGIPASRLMIPADGETLSFT